MLDKYIDDLCFFSHFQFISILQVIVFSIASRNITKITFRYYFIYLSILRMAGQFLFFYAVKNLSAIYLCIFEQTKYFFVTVGCLLFLKEKYKPYQYVAVGLLLFAPILEISHFKTFSFLNFYLSILSIFFRSSFNICCYHFKKTKNKQDLYKLFIYINIISSIVSSTTSVTLILLKNDNTMLSLKNYKHYMFAAIILFKDLYNCYMLTIVSAMNSTILSSLLQMTVSLGFSALIEKNVSRNGLITLMITLVGVLLFNWNHIKIVFKKYSSNEKPQEEYIKDLHSNTVV